MIVSPDPVRRVHLHLGDGIEKAVAKSYVAVSDALNQFDLASYLSRKHDT